MKERYELVEGSGQKKMCLILKEEFLPYMDYS